MDSIGKFSNNNVIINVLIFCIVIYCITLLSIKIQINTYWVKYNLKFYRSISPTCFGSYWAIVSTYKGPHIYKYNHINVRDLYEL
jgi:hypothetical protein